jgi:hypothetical protein
MSSHKVVIIGSFSYAVKFIVNIEAKWLTLIVTIVFEISHQYHYDVINGQPLTLSMLPALSLMIEA